MVASLNLYLVSVRCIEPDHACAEVTNYVVASQGPEPAAKPFKISSGCHVTRTGRLGRFDPDVVAAWTLGRTVPQDDVTEALLIAG